MYTLIVFVSMGQILMGITKLMFMPTRKGKSIKYNLKITKPHQTVTNISYHFIDEICFGNHLT